MALLGKDNSKAVVFLAALMVMAIAFSSSHAAQVNGVKYFETEGVKDTCTYLRGCTTSLCQANHNEGGNCDSDSDQCCCGTRLGHGVGTGHVHK
uniref:Knottin scorpion toxin-like domain-containing protein n=1 Tax=Oryza rufipogon TaxID=4529 RepID=A0A0E0RC75_ORYRU